MRPRRFDSTVKRVPKLRFEPVSFLFLVCLYFDFKVPLFNKEDDVPLRSLGSSVGAIVGGFVGAKEGSSDGEEVGPFVGSKDGSVVGVRVGSRVGAQNEI